MPKKTDITHIQPAVMIGIDRISDERVKVTLLLSKPEGDSDSGDKSDGQGTGKSDNVLSTEASTVSMAMNNLRKKTLMEIPVSSIEYFILGDEVAKSNMRRLIDMLSKNAELRLIASLYIVRFFVHRRTDAASPPLSLAPD